MIHPKGVNIHNIQRNKELIQLNIKKNKQAHYKIGQGKGSEERFFQRHKDVQPAHEKMLITTNQGKANQNHN